MPESRHYLCRMSSHHIVRDEQEPALLVASNRMLSEEGVGSLLEWSPTVVVLSPVLEAVLTWGIKVDVVVAHESEVEELRPMLKPQSPVKLLAIPEEGDLLATGLIFLHQNKYSGVNVLANLHAQGVETFTTLQEFVGVMDIVTFSQGYKCWPAKGHRYSKWMAKGQELELLPINPDQKLRTQGFYPEFANERWDAPVRVTSETEGTAIIEATGPFWIYEKIE